MTRRSRSTAVVLALAIMWVGAGDLYAAESRLTRVSLLRSGGRLSLALEMTVEPEKVHMRRLGPAMLELEVGPAQGIVERQQLTAAADVPFVGSVLIQNVAGAQRPTLRMRVSLRGPSRSNVRIVGRTVYLDFAGSDAPRQEAPAPVPAAGLPDPMPRSGPDESVPVVAAGYREAMENPMARLTEIGPFLVSAAHTPSADVLEAVARTLRAIHESLGAVRVPREAVGAHTQLTSAVILATRAVAADFTGDRVAQARAALALIEDARAQLP